MSDISDLDYQQLIEEARNPKNQQPITNPDASTKSTNSSCGDSLEVSVVYTKNGNTIENISWQGNGCVISMASMSALSELVKGKSKTEIKKLTPELVMANLGLDSIAPGRLKCLTLGLLALKQLL